MKGEIMAVSKDVLIDGKTVHFRASAAVPRMYRLKFGRDMFQDMGTLTEAFSKDDIGMDGLEVFENVAYIFAKHADPQVPDTPDEWLEEFNMFSIYQVLPELMDLWGMNQQQTAEGKKRAAQPVEK